MRLIGWRNRADPSTDARHHLTSCHVIIHGHSFVKVRCSSRCVQCTVPGVMEPETAHLHNETCYWMDTPYKIYYVWWRCWMQLLARNRLTINKNRLGISNATQNKKTNTMYSTMQLFLHDATSAYSFFSSFPFSESPSCSCVVALGSRGCLGS